MTALPLAITAIGLAWVFGWALWRGWAESGRWRVILLGLAGMLAVGLANMAMARPAAQVAAGLVVLILALSALMSYRGPGHVTAAAALAAGMLLAAGTPWPWGP